MVPVHDRVVEAEPEAVAPAGRRQLPDDVAPEWRRHHVEVGLLRIAQPKPSWCLVVMTMYFIPPALADAPRGRRRTSRIEPRANCRRRRSGSWRCCGSTRRSRSGRSTRRRNRVESPVDEHPEARLAPPVEARVSRGAGTAPGVCAAVRPGPGHGCRYGTDADGNGGQRANERARWRRAATGIGERRLPGGCAAG